MTGRTMTGRTVTGRTVTGQEGRLRRCGLVLVLLAAVAVTAGCNPENCTGHYEPRTVSRPHYTVGANGHLRFAGYRPTTDFVCVPAPTPPTTRTSRTARTTPGPHAPGSTR